MTTPNTTTTEDCSAVALPPLLADLIEVVKGRAVTPTNQPVTYGGVVYFDQKSADGARDHQERAEKLEAPWVAADRLAGWRL